MNRHAYTEDGRPMCPLPKIRRRDRRAGSLWGCSCGRIYRAMYVTAYDGTPVWSWERIEADR